MKRKIVLNGPSTLTVSLPAKWAKQNNIRKGDEVHVTEEDNVLRISVQESFTPHKKISVDVSGLSKNMYESIMVMLHRSGYDEIEVLFNTPETVRVMSDRIQSTLIGYEIVEQGPKRCLIKSISNIQKEEFENILRRTFRVTLSLADGFLEAAKREDFKDLKDLLILEQTNNRLTTYCQRIINKQSFKDEKTIYLYYILGLLESIGDDYRDIIMTILDLNLSVLNKEIINNLELVNDLLKDYYELFYKYSHQEMDKFRLKHKEVSRTLDMSALKNKKDILLNNYLHNIVNITYDCLGSTIGFHM